MSRGVQEYRSRGVQEYILTPSPEIPTEKRVRRWAISLEDIIMDPLGVEVTTILIILIIIIIIEVATSTSANVSPGTFDVFEKRVLSRKPSILAVCPRAQEGTWERGEN